MANCLAATSSMVDSGCSEAARRKLISLLSCAPLRLGPAKSSDVDLERPGVPVCMHSSVPAGVTDNVQ